MRLSPQQDLHCGAAISLVRAYCSATTAFFAGAASWFERPFPFGITGVLPLDHRSRPSSPGHRVPEFLSLTPCLQSAPKDCVQHVKSERSEATPCQWAAPRYASLREIAAPQWRSCCGDSRMTHTCALRTVFLK